MRWRCQAYAMGLTRSTVPAEKVRRHGVEETFCRVEVVHELPCFTASHRFI
jgi:hypothetical protein